jgi:DNA repair photolyase
VEISEINAKSILRTHKKIDSWFVSRYGMNLYRGCAHDCIYCDGRAEKYQTHTDFESKVVVKINAVDLLKKELTPSPRRIPLKPGFIMVGGGVGDSYQPIEKQYKLTRGVLKHLQTTNFPVHILTKSTLVERDLDILKKINDKTRAIVSFSFSSCNDKISSIFESGVPSPTKRLETIKKLKEEGFYCGMFLMPVIPFITDKPDILGESVKKAKEVGIDFIIFSGMTLKDGRQKDYFYKTLKENYPDLIVNYNNIYRADKWGSASREYYESINKTFSFFAREYKMPVRIPSFLFKDFIDTTDLVVIILEQIDYLLKIHGVRSSYGFAAYSVSNISIPLKDMRFNLRSIKGVGPTIEKIILEIIDTGSCKYYERLMNLI